MAVFQCNEVNSVFNHYPERCQKSLLTIRALIFDVASKTEGVGAITEMLKWGQPSYLTLETGSGTTIRLDRFGDSHVAIFFHCQTTLIDTFRTLFPELAYSKNRAIVLDPKNDLPIDKLSICIEMALIYKLMKKG
ncbi:DUF1801 domain-containing protein [Xenorhabdus sp. DI]|uniref:DUF1801 domain-containing protein n=1 Tax=Xenorhabdus doucetiae TaxID=351671 RepID=UPI0019B8AD14|nr:MULTISPECIES: DUF1801 domain-containing protein [unclassified Xenorhabdus]MBD2786120.1 DUF1801 domain-containing protein [Xenorhabdus sp. 3]MBD2788681.1 DUF1801 domain-containing protein [Xenorhabdus sp. DI]